MFGVLSRIAKAFSFVRISHGEIFILLVVVPFTLSAIIMAINYALFGTPGLIGRSFFANMLALIISLPGFLLAALAAVATFGNSTLDQEIPAPSPTLSIHLSGHLEELNLTYRVYLSLLFGYLSALTLVLAILLSMVMAVPPKGVGCLVTTLYVCRATTELARMTGLFLGVHVVTVTLYGLYYVSWRMHIRS